MGKCKKYKTYNSAWLFWNKNGYSLWNIYKRFKKIIGKNFNSKRTDRKNRLTYEFGSNDIETYGVNVGAGYEF